MAGGAVNLTPILGRWNGMFDPILQSGNRLGAQVGALGGAFGNPTMDANDPAAWEQEASRRMSMGDIDGAMQAKQAGMTLRQNAQAVKDKHKARMDALRQTQAESDIAMAEIAGQRKIGRREAANLESAARAVESKYGAEIAEMFRRDPAMAKEMILELGRNQRNVADNARQIKIQQMKQDAEKAKERAKVEKEAAEGAIARRKRVSSDIVELNETFKSLETVEGMIDEVGEWEFAVLKGIPNTDAMALDDAITPLKSELAFSRLQKMRDESKTGGALGQVSNIELKLLEQNLVALNPKSKSFPDQVAKVRKHYENARAALMGQKPDVDWGYYEEQGYSVEHEGKRYMVDPATGEWYQM